MYLEKSLPDCCVSGIKTSILALEGLREVIVKVMLFLLLSYTLTLSAETESQANALFKGVNPLREAMGQPAAYANQLHHPTLHLWDPSLVKVGDTYHLICTGTPMTTDRLHSSPWMTKQCLPVHATAKSLNGPWTWVDGGKPQIQASQNHGYGMHNAKVTEEYNPDGSVKRYVLYFINVNNGVSGTSWFYNDDMSPGAWYGRSPAVKDGPFNNPAMLTYPDGSAYMISKGKDKKEAKVASLLANTSSDFNAKVKSDKEAYARWDANMANNRGGTNHLGLNVGNEDACIWEVANQYHTVMTDYGGRATGGLSKALVHYYTDSWKNPAPGAKNPGTNYLLYSDIPLYYVHVPIVFADGVIKKIQLYGTPFYLCE